jgi:hypothetical protein
MKLSLTLLLADLCITIKRLEIMKPEWNIKIRALGEVLHKL